MNIMRYAIMKMNIIEQIFLNEVSNDDIISKVKPNSTPEIEDTIHRFYTSLTPEQRNAYDSIERHMSGIQLDECGYFFDKGIRIGFFLALQLYVD